MAAIGPKNSLPDTLWPPLARLWRLSRRLQWKLTLNYALFTAVTALVVGIVNLALLWYFTFWSPDILNRAANELLVTGSFLSPYLQSTPPNRIALNNWLRKTVMGGDLDTKAPVDGGNAPIGDGSIEADPPPRPPRSRLERVVSLAVVNNAGQIVLGYPSETFSLGSVFPIPTEAMGSFQAAIQGKTDPALLAAHNAAGNTVATAPIFGSEGQLLGVIFVETAPPIKESDFLQMVLRQTVLPVVLGILLIGGVAGVFFGYFIAHDLTRRLYALAGAADAWSNGDFDVLVPDSSGDELGQLARRLNRMALQLQTLLQTRQELATLDERNRLARDLHDAVKQQVFATAMQAGAALALFDQNPAASKKCLIETDQLVRQTQQELTSLIQELRPAALEDKGLTAALREYVGNWSRQNDIPAEVRVRGEQSMSFLLEQTFFRVTQEALANTARHSNATAVEVYLAWEESRVTLTISDNGRGFNPATPHGKGLGLRSMRERVEAIGGHFSVTSQTGGGTRVTVRCDKPPK